MNVKLHAVFRFLFLVPCLLITGVKAQNVQVSGAIVGDGNYVNLTAAFTALNGAAQTNANIAISILGNTTEATTATLNANDWKFLTISPSGGAPRSITGNLTTALINFYGASNIHINGLNTGGDALTIDNTATGATSSILFNNDCKNITVENCTILGSASADNFGTIFFGTASSIGSGNDLIRIKSCTLDASSGGNPVNAIYSGGSTMVGLENNNDSIINSNIANFFSATLASSGILLGAGNSNWNIRGCRFYQSATRTYTTANTHRAIQILSGNGYSISTNTIGYAASAGTGVYTMTSTVNSQFNAIDLSVGTTTASSLQGNTITAIELTSPSAILTGSGILCGIHINAGNVNIGDLIPNIIGGATGTDLIKAIPGTTLAAVVGISSASTGSILIKSNTIGGLTSSNPTVTIGGSVYGISISGLAASLVVSENTIGNGTVDNMRAGNLTTTANSVVGGIYFTATPLTTSITKNTIQNLSSYGSNTGGFVRGICTASGFTNPAPLIISDNKITKLTSNSSLPNVLSGQSAAAGITLSIGTNDVISNNIISDIALTGTGTNNTYAVGIGHANGTNTIIKNNKISNITNAGTSTNPAAPSVAAGILIRTGNNDLSIFNNMISLGSASAANTAFVGILANHGITPDPVDYIYHNTINISGTVTAGAQPSFCFLRGDFTTNQRTATVIIKNNIFTNTRSGGTGQHFAIGNNYGAATSSVTGWAKNTSNNNVLNANAGTIGWWNSAQTFAGWQTAAIGDSASYSGFPVTYVDPASDLHLNMGTTPTVIESGGQTIASVTTDIDNDTRPGPTSVNGGGTAPDIGADEIDAAPKDAFVPHISLALLTATCDTIDRTLTATIVDPGTVPVSGALQPRVYYRKNKNAWVSSQGVLSSGTSANGTWSFPILKANVGGVKGTDTISYFVIAQDISGNIASNPSAGLVASDVNTVTTAPTAPYLYAVLSTPVILSAVHAAVCDSGTVNLSVTANSGIINWYALSAGGASLGTGNSFITPVVKTTTPFYAEASENGCKSPRVAAWAEVNATKTTIITTDACDSLKLLGKVYKTSGTYLDTTVTVKGCDSLITLNLTIKKSSTSTQTISICDSLRWNETLYTASGIYKDTIPNKAGCDSLMVLNLTIKHSTTSTQTVNACGPYNWNGTLYPVSGTYKDTIPNSAGCDSLMLLNLTVTYVNATVKVNSNIITADSVADAYQWVDCLNNYSVIAGATSQSYTVTANGSYAVIETKNGCIDTSTCVPVIITGIATTEKDIIQLYPNPGRGVYTLLLPEQSQLKVLSLTGEVVYEERLTKGTHTLDLMKLTNGVYIMQLFTTEQMNVLKLIKQE